MLHVLVFCLVLIHGIAHVVDACMHVMIMCWENSDFLSLSMPVSLTEKSHHSHSFTRLKIYHHIYYLTNMPHIDTFLYFCTFLKVSGSYMFSCLLSHVRSPSRMLLMFEVSKIHLFKLYNFLQPYPWKESQFKLVLLSSDFQSHTGWVLVFPN